MNVCGGSFFHSLLYYCLLQNQLGALETQLQKTLPSSGGFLASTSPNVQTPSLQTAKTTFRQQDMVGGPFMGPFKWLRGAESPLDKCLHLGRDLMITDLVLLTDSDVIVFQWSS